mmetsp:Transcript_37771/g.60622  ORF Transcript_37771/g.60622 Transcript_37771/m.60622 type:complete len:343 (+) Transcript_37771:199-1227(+)
MGGLCVSCSCNPCRPVRTNIQLNELKDMDILLIRSCASVGGLSIDERVISGMHFEMGSVYHDLYSLDKYNKVGIVVLPDDEKEELSTDNIMVTMAEPDKIKTISLKELLSESLDVVVRQLEVANPGGAIYSGMSGGHTELKEQPNSQSNTTMSRPEMLEELYRFIGSTRKPYGEPSKGKDALKPMLEYIDEKIKCTKVSQDETNEMKRILDIAGVGDPLKGLSFDDILKVFDHMRRSRTMRNTFSEGDVRTMATMLKDTGYLSRESFLQFHSDASNRSLIAMTQPVELTTGAFVSLVLQRLGVFPEHFFCTPMEFSFGGISEEHMMGAALGPERTLDAEKFH